MMEEKIDSQDFSSNPLIMQNYQLLTDIGVFKHIEQLNRELKDCKDLLTGAVDIFNKISISEILDAAVRKISDQFLPSFITFLWKPHQNREDVIIKSYKNYKPVDISLAIETIEPFEPFFNRFPKPVAFGIFEFQESHINPSMMNALKKLDPELLIPIMGPFGLYGIVFIGSKILSKGYTLDELFFLEKLMSFLSQAVQNNLHYEHSVRDVKTGLYNHGYFLTRLAEEIARTKREKAISSLIVMDVDKFKIFNDTYGHLAGDKVLESLAFMIKQSLRTGDVPSRFGGEEFTLLLTNTPRKVAWSVAERLRMSVSAMKVPWDPPLPQITISLGLVSFDGQTNGSAEEIISRADEALYQSKENGRNRTSVWGAGLLFRLQQNNDPGSAIA